MDNYLKAVGYNVKMQRAARGWSRRVLGEKVGLSSQSIWNIETGRTNPTLITLYKLAETLRTHIALLVSESHSDFWYMPEGFADYIKRLLREQGERDRQEREWSQRGG